MEIDYINSLINNKDTWLHRALYYGLRRRDRSIQYGLLDVTKQYLKDTGRWDEYLVFDAAVKRIFNKIMIALMKAFKKQKILYG